MAEIRYTATPELRDPARFLAAAFKDLRMASGIAWRLYSSHLLARRRRSALGHLWLVVPTLATTIACIHLQALNVVNAGQTAVPYPVFALAGVVFWQVFVDAINAPLQQLAMARQLLTRSRVPHEALILAGALDVLLNCALRSAILVAALFALAVPLGPSLLLVPIGVASLLLLGLGMGVLVAPLGLLYEDLGRGIAALTALLFFLTPVAYSIPAAGAPGWNPVGPLLQTTRAWLFSQAATENFVPIAVAALAALMLSWLFYRIGRPHLVAHLG